MPTDDGLEPLPASLARTWGNTETMAGHGSAGSKERTEEMSESEHDRALRQHDARYEDMKRMAREFGRDSDQYRQAREDVVEAARAVRPARLLAKKHRGRWS